jgi:ABC-2 type transport system permease protein
MTTITLTRSNLVVPRPALRQTAIAFWYILWRDIWVTLKDWRTFFGMTFVQPVLLLFVFGWLLPRLGQLPSSYSLLLVPGIIAMVILLTAMQSVSFPLTIDFGYTREIEDRLLAPVPVVWVGLAKMVFAAVPGLVSGLLLGALAYALLIDRHAMGIHPVLLLLVATLTAFCGSAAGLALGTLVKLNNVSLIFTIVITPLGFLGCVYFPWNMLGGIRWLQVLTCLNPLTYASEGLRAGMNTVMPHMPVAFVLTGQFISLVGLGSLGLRGFSKKAVD